MKIDKSTCQRVASMVNNNGVNSLMIGNHAAAHTAFYASVFLMQYAFVEPDETCAMVLESIVAGTKLTEGSFSFDVNFFTAMHQISPREHMKESTSSHLEERVRDSARLLAAESPIAHGPKPILIDTINQPLQGQNLDLCSAAILYNFALSHAYMGEQEASGIRLERLKVSAQVAILGFEVIDKHLAEMNNDARVHQCALEMGAVILDFTIRLLACLGEERAGQCYQYKFRLYESQYAISVFSEACSNAGAA